MSDNHELPIAVVTHALGHDLKAPVRHIRDFLHLLIEENQSPLTESQQSYKNHIDTAVNDLSQKITRLSDYTQLFTKQRKNDTVNICAIISTAVLVAENQTKAIVNWQHPINDTFFNSYTCEDNVQIAIEELLKNALLYTSTSSKPEIFIDVQLDESSEIMVTFSDNGIGISENLIDAVFLPYRRLHNEQAYGGYGMGLTIAKAAIELIGGTVTLRQNKHDGIDACLTIPVMKATGSRTDTTTDPNKE